MWMLFGVYEPQKALRKNIDIFKTFVSNPKNMFPIPVIIQRQK